MIRILLIFAFAIGLGTSVATWIEHSRQLSLFCTTSGCESVLSSAYAEWLGVPLPAIGVIAFTFQLALVGHWIWPNRMHFVGLNRRSCIIAVSLLGAAVGIGLIAAVKCCDRLNVGHRKMICHAGYLQHAWCLKIPTTNTLLICGGRFSPANHWPVLPAN